MVAVGLMAILLTMIATIFYQATQAFRVARASIQIHESARAALNALVNDLTAAEFCSYDNGVQGYFALSQYSDPDPTNAPKVTPTNQLPGTVGQPPAFDTLTFTTLAPQPGARYAATEAVLQTALVRYALEWDGTSARVPGSNALRPTYNFVKRVRFPNTAYPALNMDDFNVNDLKIEVDLSDPNWMQYAQSEAIAFHVLSMNVRVFCLPEKTASETSEVFLETGTASYGTSNTLTDTTKTNWTSLNFPVIGSNPGLRIYAGTDAGQGPLAITSMSSGNTLTVSSSMPHNPDSTSLYRIEDTLYALPGGTGTSPSSPGWYQRGNYNFFGTTYRPPAMVEVTLEMTDVRATRSFIFTQRFYIPASER
jgi:type II secretory pathway pseudopilin PulG